jgi:S1-C subfamily serine protease
MAIALRLLLSLAIATSLAACSPSTRGQGASGASAPATAGAGSAHGTNAAVARSGVPDFTSLVERVGPAVVNVSTSRTLSGASRMPQAPDDPAVGGNPEIIGDGHNGRLIAAGDAQALHAALDDLLWDAPLRRRLAETAREWVRANASLDAVCAAYDRFYLRALRTPL